MLFNDIPGLDSVKDILQQSVHRNHVAHALLFDGSSGSGALAMALAFATYLNCENKTSNDACGQCASCRKMSKFAHPDVHYIFPVAKTKKQEVATSDAFMPLWREFLTQSPFVSFSEWLDFVQADNKQAIIAVEEARNILRKLYLKAYEGEYKILLIWKPELMNIPSSNALLKILEEPPAKTLFLLVSDQSDKLIPTIQSRVQRIHIPSFNDQEVKQYLIDTYQTDESAASQIAYLSEGNMAIARQHLVDTLDDRPSFFAEWMRNCYKHNFIALIKTADQFGSFSKEAQKQVLEYALSMFRDLLLYQEEASNLLRVPSEELKFVQNFSKTVDYTSLTMMIQEANDAYFAIERNVNPKIVFLDLSIAFSNSFKR